MGRDFSSELGFGSGRDFSDELFGRRDSPETPTRRTLRERREVAPIDRTAPTTPAPRAPKAGTLLATPEGRKQAFTIAENIAAAAAGVPGIVGLGVRRKLEQRARSGETARDAARDDGFADRAGSLLESGYHGAVGGGARLGGTLTGSDIVLDAARVAEKAAAAPIAGRTEWDDVKQADGMLATTGKALKFGHETGIQSLPEMAITAIPVVGVPLAMAIQTGRIGQQRAENDGRTDASLIDLAVAAPFAAGSAALEKIGIMGVGGKIASRIGGRAASTTVGRMATAAITEGGTEFFQEATEYAGGSLGTKAGFDPRQAVEQGIAGAIGGGVMGGGLSIGVEGIRQSQRLISREGETRTPAPGVIESAEEQAAATLSQADIDSPIDTADIVSGRAATARASAVRDADAGLGAHGLPPVGKRIVIDMGDGGAITGTMKDWFEDETGRGVVYEEDGGRTRREYLDNLADAGVGIREESPISEADRIDADLARRAEQSIAAAEATDEAGISPPAESVRRQAPSSPKPGRGSVSPVGDGGAIIREVFGKEARITSTYRGPDHPLSKANPASWHTKSHAAADMAPIPGMTFEQARQAIVDAGYNVIEGLNEVGKGRTKHATGDHWHFVIGQGGQPVGGGETARTAADFTAASIAARRDDDAPMQFEGIVTEPLAQREDAPVEMLAAPDAAQSVQETARKAELRGETIDAEWTRFAPESGTLAIPRDEMPQIKAEKRGAMVKFLNARDIAHEEITIPAIDLKPTQAEFSEIKVQKARDGEGGNRAILASSDGYVLDGHHQWMAARDAGEDIRTIRLDAPIRELINTVGDMPSTETATGKDVPKVESGGAQAALDAGPSPNASPVAPSAQTSNESAVARVPAAVAEDVAQVSAVAAPLPTFPTSPTTPSQGGETTDPGISGAIDTPRREPIAAKSPDAGADDVAITITGREVPVRYAVVSVRDIVTSHTADGAINPEFPKAMQPRDRSRGTSKAQVAEMAARLDPRLLGKTAKASDGAPIIAPDGVVESGNGRTLAIARAYAMGSQRARDYKAFIEQQGFSTEGVDRPVLVRVRQGEMADADIEAFTREANQRDTAGFSSTETAASDASALSGNVLALYRGGDVDAAGNRDFVRAFIDSVVPTTERANMIAADGAVSQDAVRRIGAAMIQRAFGNPQLVTRLTEATDTNIKAIGGALGDVSAAWARMVEAAKDGRIDPDMAITANLNEAVDLVDRARRDGVKVADLVNQRDIFSGQAISTRTEAVLRLMFRNSGLTQPVSRQKLAERLTWYVDQAMLSSADTGLFGNEQKASPDDVLGMAKEKFSEQPAEQGDLLAAARPRDAGDGDGVRQGEPAGAGRGEGISGQPVEAGVAQGERLEADTATDELPADLAGRLKPFPAEGNPSGFYRFETPLGPITWHPKDGIANGASPKRTGVTADDIRQWLNDIDAGREQGAKQSKPAAPDRIKDFGEKLHGARKDTWQSYKDKLREATAADVLVEPLSKLWPEPDYQKMVSEGADAYIVASMRAMRDAIPSKPRSYGVVGWGRQVETLRGAAMQMLDDGGVADSFMRKLEGEFSRSLRDLQGSITLYTEFGHERSFKGISLAERHYGLYRGEKNVTKWTIEQSAKATAFSNWPRELAVGDSLNEVLAKFGIALSTGALDPKKRAAVVRFDIYSRRSEPGFWIGKKIGKQYADLKRFDTAKEARAFKGSEEGYAEHERLLEQYRDIPPERKEVNSPRIGVNHRGGADVTPEQFSETFGFRGVQFGNYVEGSRRRSDLNQAYDALMDLAGIIGVPPQALSLNGELGLAFGARGKGAQQRRAAAHFEPDHIVINLTKGAGAGSLAHEWWHSLDNYFSRMRAPGGFMTEGTIAGTDGVRPEMAAAFHNVMGALKQTALKERSRNLDKRRTKDYWSTNIEMSARAFESYVIAKLQDEQFSNDYLANIVPDAAWMIEDGYPYLKAAEIPVVRAAFDEFFQTVETRQTDKGVALHSVPEPADLPLAATLTGKEVATAPDHGSRVRQVLDWYRRTLRPRQVISSDGVKTRFSRVSESKIRTAGDSILAAFPSVAAIIEKGRHQIVPASPKWADKGVVRAHRYEARVNVAGKIGVYGVIVHEVADGRRFYYFDTIPEVGDAGGRTSLSEGALGTDPIEVAPGAINLFVVGTEINTPDAGRDLAALQARLETYLPRKVAVRLVESLDGAAGSFSDRLIQIATDTGQDGAFTLDHEVVHALRALGLFNTSEWAILSAKARRDTALMRSIRQRYARLDAEAQVEEAVADMFARWQRSDYKAEGAVARVFKALRSALEAIGNAFRGNGLRTAEGVMADVASGEMGGRPVGAARGGGKRSIPEQDRFTTEWLTAMAAVDEIFQNEASSATSLRGTFGDIAPKVRFERALHAQDDLTGDAYKGIFDKYDADRATFFKMPVGGRLVVFERGKEVWLDVHRLRSGEGGSQIYQAVADYAFNTGKVFIGDPDGLSDIALRRRTDAMLSSALKHGTTDHLAPHPRQEEGDASLGAPPLAWTEGDTASNIQNMIDVSLVSLGHDVPQVRDANFDFADGTFRDEAGRVLTDDDMERAAVAARRSGSQSAGRATLKRGILLKSLARAESSSRPGLLERVLNQHGQSLLRPGLKDTFYSIPEREGPLARSDAPFERASDGAPGGYSRGPVRDLLASTGAGSVDPVFSALDAVREKLQDKMIAVLRTQEAVANGLRRSIAEDQNAYLAEELYTGRAGRQLEQLYDERIEPLMAAMHKEGVSLDELESYLYARHAPERNLQMAKINPAFTEGEGSGMTDIEARAILNRIKRDGKEPVMQALARYVDRIRDEALQARIDSGLLSEEEAMQWRGTYKHYVPLRGKAEVEGDVRNARGITERARSQSGMSVKGKESRRAYGRRSKADNILAYTILQAEEAIIRAEKNRAAKALLHLAEGNPDPEFWQVDKIERRPVIDSKTGLVRYENQTRLAADDAPYTITAKVEGVEHRVTMNRDNPTAVRVAKAMRNLGGPEFGTFMTVASMFSQAFSAINTRYNPSFVVRNALRDIQTMAFIAQSYDDDLPGFSRKVLRDYRKAMTARRDGDGEWSKWRKEWEFAGGKIYYNQTRDLGQIRNDLALRAKHMSNPKSAAGVWHRTFDYLEAANEAVERAIRLSVYKNAREAGKSPSQAASMSRNVTVNFTRKGKWNPNINALFPFFNASVQGSTNLIRVMGNRKVRLAAAGFVIAGVLSDVMNSMVGGDDDDGEAFWDKVPQFEKSKNMILMLPGGDKGQAVKFPLGWGLNALFGLGRNASAMARGAMKPGEAAMASALEFYDAFNPIGGSGHWLNTLAPTFLDPFIEVSENVDFTGKPIQPEQSPFETPKPDSENYYGQPGWAKGLAKGLNAWSGGDAVVPGAISMSPNTIEHLTGFVTGGAGRFVGDAISLVMQPFDPEAEPLSIRDFPIARDLVTAKSPWVDRSLYFSRVHEVREVEDRARMYEKRGDMDGGRAYVQANLQVARMEGATDEASKIMSKVRKVKAKLSFEHEMERIDEADYAAKMKRAKAIEDKVVAAYNRRWMEVVEQAAED